MRLHRYLKEPNIDLDFRPFGEDVDDYAYLLEGEDEDDFDEDALKRRRWKGKEEILRKLVTLLEPSGKITNPKRCFTDLRNREAKATTGFGLGVAMPHVRTAQAKDFTIGVAIAPEPGYWFDALDEEPVRIFIPMVAPAYNDKFYRKVEKKLAEAVLQDDENTLQRRLIEAEDAGEVVLILRDIID